MHVKVMDTMKKVEFHSDCNSVGRVKDEGDCDVYLHIGHMHSPLLDPSVRVVYLPEDLGGGKVSVVDRYLCHCVLCGGMCPSATLDKQINEKTVSVLHCNSEVRFFFIAGKLTKGELDV